MQFSTLLIASAAFVLASAEVKLGNIVYNNITAGQPFDINWYDADGPVSLILRVGTDQNNLLPVYTIESNLSGENGTYTWDVPANIPQDTYAIEIRDSDSNNYSSLWEVIDGVVSSSVSRTVTRTSTGTSTGTETITSTSTNTATESAQTESSTTSTRRSTSATPTPTSTPSPTAAPAGGMANGLTSNLALVFVAVGALFMLN